jgi:hypothetical protein
MLRSCAGPKTSVAAMADDYFFDSGVNSKTDPQHDTVG